MASLMVRRNHFAGSRLLPAGAVALVLALAPSPVTAQPRAGWRPELTFVPEDAAAFVYLDAEQLWGSSAGRAVREANPKLFAALEGKARDTVGFGPNAISSVTLFYPNLKNPNTRPGFGVVLGFRQAYDRVKLKAGFTKLAPSAKGVSIHTPSDRVAVLLDGLGEEYARPRPVGKPGPLLRGLAAAATGKHLLVAGLTLANFPDEVRGENLPPGLEPVKPIFHAESVTAVVDLGKVITLNVRVKVETAAAAKQVPKALEFVTRVLAEGIDEGIREFAGDTEAAPGVKDLLTVMKALQGAVKGMKVSVEGTEIRATATMTADLPFGGAFTGAVAEFTTASEASASQNNLRQIGIAMHNYHDTHEVLPPASVCDKTGKPLLSWRVLILPYVGEEALFKQFRLNEPWDSEHNKKLLPKMPRVYALPGKAGGRPNETHYRVFVGNGAGFDYVKPMRFADFTDGTSNTILAVIAAESVPWTKPDELTFDPRKEMGKLLGTVAGGRHQAVYFDGSVRTFKKLPLKAVMNGLITRGGGEINPNDVP